MKRKHLRTAIVAAFVASIALLILFGPGGVLVPRETRDYSDNVTAYCTEALVAMHNVPGFEDIAAYGFPAVSLSGERPTFLCPARSWRGSYIVRVRGRCAIPVRCTFVDAIEDSAGRIVYAGT